MEGSRVLGQKERNQREDGGPVLCAPGLLVKVDPGLRDACPLLPREGLTPKLRIYRNKTTRPQQGSAGRRAAEHPRDAPRALEPQTRIWMTYLSSFMAISKGSVSPSSSTITGAHILQV